MESSSLASIPEIELVKFLYERVAQYRHLTVPPRTGVPFSHHLEVEPEDLDLPRDSFGDIDALLVPKGHPELATAIQFKRIKLTTSNYRMKIPSKLGALRKLAHQANAIAAVGFYRVWIVVLTVVDTREFDLGWQLPLGHAALMAEVRHAVPMALIEASIGVHVTELAQTVDRPISDSGQFGGHLMRVARQRVQPDHLTRRIEAFVLDHQPSRSHRL